MTIPTIAGSSWNSSIPAESEPPTPAPDAWQATRAQTQLVRDEDDYLATEQRDIGRLVGDNLRELFVSCDPGPAMQQQFEHLHPEFIAVHDIATHASRKLLAGVAAASKKAVHKLVIRRQGHGNTLATIEFVELPTAEGGVLRIYATEADADTVSRRALATTLLAFSTLGVILVGDVPLHAMAATLKPLHDDMRAGPWPNRQLLMLPLSAANALVTHGVELSRGTGVNVRTTPQVTRPADAWNFISSTWTRLHGESTSRTGSAPVYQTTRPGGIGSNMPATTASRSAEPLPLRPMPSVSGAASRSEQAQDPLSRYVHQLSELTGMVSCCVFEVATGREIVHAGASPGAAALAEHGSELLAAMLSTSRTLGLGHALPDAAITLGAHHLLLRAVPKHPGFALHAVLECLGETLWQAQRLNATPDERVYLDCLERQR